MAPSIDTGRKSRRRSTARRSHVLGGCKTCRIRHIKCDQTRPTCHKCRAIGIVCGGFPDGIQWTPVVRHWPSSAGHDETMQAEEGPSSARRHLFTEQSRICMSASMHAGLVGGSLDASLEELEMRLHDPEITPSEGFRIGPFGVLNVPREDTVAAAAATVEAERDQAMSHRTDVSIANDGQSQESFLSMGNYEASNDDLIPELDLFGTDIDFTGLLPGPFDMMDCFNPNSDFQQAPKDTQHNSLQLGGYTKANKVKKGWTGPKVSLKASVSHHTNSEDDLTDASFLLKIFHDYVLPHITVISISESTPWRALHLSDAIMAHGELTILSSQAISHARLANLYSLLASSALYVALNPIRPSERSSDYWSHVAEQNYSLAKHHIQISFKEETRGPHRASFKNQLMASCGMTQTAILHGKYEDARCCIIDAERMMRLRGLQDCRVSRDSRLLLNLYSWLRIMGESTYVLHDYKRSHSPPVGVPKLHIYHNEPSPSNDMPVSNNDQDSPVDDFLHIDPQHSNNCDLDIEQPKDQEMDILDFHLQDSRKSSRTLSPDVYCVPETWLSLVSQTTRLANVIDICEASRDTDGQHHHRQLLDSLHARSVYLENVINAFNLKFKHENQNIATDFDGDPATFNLQTFRAFNSALIVFFYRRIRHVHPAILEGEVDKIINTLRAFDAGLPKEETVGSSILWSAFIAGCEAISPSQRVAILHFMEREERACAFASVKTAKKIMTDLWKEHDQCLGVNHHKPLPTWIEIARKQQVWPVMC